MIDFQDQQAPCCLLPYIIKTHQLQILTPDGNFALGNTCIARGVVISRRICASAYAFYRGQQLINLGIGGEGLVGFAKCFDIDSWLWLIEALNSSDDLLAVNGWAVYIAAQRRRDRLLNGIKQLGSLLHCYLFHRGLYNGGDHLLLQGEDVDLAIYWHDPRRIGLALDQVGDDVAIVF